jgi:hypothetical protein
MSILRVDAIRDNGSGFNDVVTFANSGGTENGKLARAWVNFNGQGTLAIRSSFNVNSLSDLGTGKYGMTMTNAVSSSAFALFHSASDDNVAACCSYEAGTFANRSTTYAQMYAYALGSGPRDIESASMGVFR